MKNMIFWLIIILIFCQIDDDFLANYQLSYGFNSNDNTTTNVSNTGTNSLETKASLIQHVKDQSESTLNDSNEKPEGEKRKLPQPSEPGKN